MIHGVEESNDVLLKWRIPLLCGLGGLLLLLVGWRVYGYRETEKVEFIDSREPSTDLIRVDISGAVQKPDVYEMTENARVQDVIEQAGGLTDVADLEWVAKRLNLAASLSDGAKIYIPTQGEQNQTNLPTGNATLGIISSDFSKSSININSASKSELEDLPGIGPVSAEKIIANRPYQMIEELVNRKIIGKKTMEMIKEMINTY